MSNDDRFPFPEAALAAVDTFLLDVKRKLVPRRLGTDADRARFRAKVTASLTGCWLWQGTPNTDGYGTFCFGHRKTYAHRALHELFVGPIPCDGDGKPMHIDHRCRNKLCVRPFHLEAVTQHENNRRKRIAREDLPKVKQPTLGGSQNAIMGELQLLIPREYHRPIAAILGLVSGNIPASDFMFKRAAE